MMGEDEPVEDYTVERFVRDKRISPGSLVECYSRMVILQQPFHHPRTLGQSNNEDIMSTVEDQLEEARRSLLDMSLRNKLLSFKEYSRSTAQVVDEVPSQVYEHLVLDENSMSFLPSEAHPDHQEFDEVDQEDAVEILDDGTHICLSCDEPDSEFVSRERFRDHLESEHGSTIQSDDDTANTPGEMEGLWALPELSTSGEDRHTDSNLQTPHTETDLQKRLYNISNRAEALIEDAGYNALHLAIGFLEWTEAAAQEGSNKAPLILVPVTLDRKGAQSAFNITWNQEEVTGNLSLELKLSEQSFELPEFQQPAERSGIRTYLETVEEAVADIDQWEVVPDLHLGFFDFTKFIMYQDLDPEAWEAGNTPADHHLLRALLDPEETTEEPPAFDEDLIDEELTPLDVHHVKDADPSQIAAIEDVKRGRNLVIEGPPGTGKSQTIVNMIAELIAEDKTVLFVSEKLAALDVVKDRLDSVGIGDFCLELHSDKASKSDFLDELERIAKIDSYEPDIPRDTFDKLSQKQGELDAYAEALRTPFGELELTPYALYGQREEAGNHFEEKGMEVPRAEIADPTDITPGDHQAALSALETLGSRLEGVQPVSDHPWFGCRPGAVLPDERRKIQSQLEKMFESLQELNTVRQTLETECAVQPQQTLGSVRLAIDAARVLEESTPVDAEVLQNSAWNRVPPEAEKLIELVARNQELQADVGSRADPSHVSREPAELLTEYRQLHDSLLRFVRPRWYSLGSELSTLYGDESPSAAEEVIQDLEDLIELQEKEAEFEDVRSRGHNLFGSLWQGESSDPDRLREFSTWVVDFREHLLDDVYSDDSLEMVTRGVSQEALAETRSAAETTVETVEQNLERFIEMVGLNVSEVFGTSLDEVPLPSMVERLQTQHTAIDRLERWSRFDQTRSEVLDTPAAPVIELLGAGQLSAGDLLPCYQANLADGLLSAAFRERQPLARFDGEVHEGRIESFQELDQQSLKIHQKRVFSKLVDRTPQLMQGSSKSSPAGTLFHEFGKERRHKPIRVLLEEAGALIQQMKPCFMMSPLSVAKYLEPDGIDFDVVIFDEASQVKPEDALGTILRGQQVVMLGDTKQLPPTSFFDQVVDQRDSEEEWGFHVQDVESILDLCRSSFPSKRLRWHYRSRHESLIAVSNQEFYNNELLIYPSPVQESDDLGLRFEHLPETVYDRGGSSINCQEAKAVAEAAVEHYRTHPSKSLGVGTFSQAQQQAIQEEIELLRKENPEIDEYFSHDREERFFVKNLERIQGDERDVIYISVGYGYDSDRKFSHNFGPLNSRGGWRRLNVLITRAREQCVVFANFTADALDASKINNRGLRSLKVFMEYAETRNLTSLTEVGSDPDSPFERGVIRYLEAEGFEVHPQVGCAGFRIDLAIPDPDYPGRYVLGIECDGASYHSSPVARARDRQRQAVLEDRGWRIHRVWSTDWYREKERTKERLVAAIEDAIETRSTEPVSSDPGDSQSGEDEIDDNPSIEELQGDGAGIRLEDIGTAYAPASNIPYSRLGDHDLNTTVHAVEHIVNQEGPIHRELLAKRIVDYSDVSRQGRKVSATIDKSIAFADRNGKVDRRGKFIYPTSFDGHTIRRRNGMEADIEWIPDGEIELATIQILEKQYETPKGDLVKQVAKAVGFSRTGTRISDRIGSIIESMKENGGLEISSGRLTISESS